MFDKSFGKITFSFKWQCKLLQAAIDSEKGGKGRRYCKKKHWLLFDGIQTRTKLCLAGLHLSGIWCSCTMQSKNRISWQLNLSYVVVCEKKVHNCYLLDSSCIFWAARQVTWKLYHSEAMSARTLDKALYSKRYDRRISVVQGVERY